MKAEDVRQELLVAEMKRDRTSKEVVRLNDECVRKRMEVAEVEAQLRERVREIRDLERQGIHREEVKFDSFSFRSKFRLHVPAWYFY